MDNKLFDHFSQILWYHQVLCHLKQSSMDSTQHLAITLEKLKHPSVYPAHAFFTIKLEILLPIMCAKGHFRNVDWERSQSHCSYSITG